MSFTGEQKQGEREVGKPEEDGKEENKQKHIFFENTIMKQNSLCDKQIEISLIFDTRVILTLCKEFKCPFSSENWCSFKLY